MLPELSSASGSPVSSFNTDHPPIGKRHSRRKRHLAWEQAELASGGLYARYLDEIAHRCPTLTPMELRVGALVKALLPSWKIGEFLGITEKTVENHRRNIRVKIGCEPGAPLLHKLL